MSDTPAVAIYCAHTELVDIDKLVENPRNPNQHPEAQIALLAKIIRSQGFRNPVVVSKRSGFITKGHGRLAAARLLKMPRVPVDYQDYESEAAEWADMIADNRIAELAETDDDALKALLKELDGQIDLDLTGFDEDSLDDILDRLETSEDDTNTIPTPPVDPVTQPGDLYELGPHRLLCGDSTDPEHVKRLMNGERAILFATDPPYLVGYDGTNHPGTRPKTNTDWSETYGPTWDEADLERNNDLYDRFIKVAVEHAIEPYAAWYCWHASRRQMMVEQAWEKNGAFVHQQIIWHKPNRPILTRSWYLWAHEPCFFGWVKGQKPPRADKEYLRSVWDIEGLNNDERPDHPTPKPLECFAIPMRQHTLRGELCYEPFSGSGSQLIAGEQLGRRVFGMEISPAYCDVIVSRYLALGEGRRVFCNGQDVTERFLSVTDQEAHEPQP
ncbi:site-specific DNA-methyltransferase [Ruficoccus amylovorans]|uniref:Methyltransferase n=1 Tax=Ruficoccus amylovorans TaxID=1804625 RepID=A0A842H8E7_9BACT|nr:DNA methyltransferase [Ruficoccus amylovorans]MBC2592803.1 site-specific DNA-methyltransferase [Ruficoccus amylovorans]